MERNGTAVAKVFPQEVCTEFFPKDGPMHIHGGHMNPSLNGSGARVSESALAARRAEETRKKLFSSASELEATSSTESAWMVGAWSGSGSGSGSGAGANTGSGSKTDPGSPRGAATPLPSEAEEQQTWEEIQQLTRTPRSGPVSFWA
jgi:hypothetical protein